MPAAAPGTDDTAAKGSAAATAPTKSAAGATQATAGEPQVPGTVALQVLLLKHVQTPAL